MESKTADQAIQQDFTLNGNETMHGWKNFKTVTGITLTSGTEDGSIKIGTSGGMVETTRYTAKYEGTDFDDVIFWDEATEFKSDMGTKFSLASTVEMSFDAGKGDDVIYGPTKTKDGKDAGTAADTPNIDYSYVI